MIIIILFNAKKKRRYFFIFLALFLLFFLTFNFLLREQVLFYKEKVKPGVVFLKEPFEKITPEEVMKKLAARLAEWQINPIDARYNPELNSIVPELWGYRIDLEKTADRIMAASAGEEVQPVFQPIMPEITINDYPSAFIKEGNPQKREIAFMVNVAWGTEYIIPMLEVLQEGDSQATFFVTGKWANSNGELLKEIVKRGNLLGNHGHTDAVVFTEITVEEMERGLREVNDLIERETGQKTLYFTPHKGEYNQLVLETVSRLGMRTILWSVDTIDWMNPGLETIKAMVLNNKHNGAIVLMHPTSDTVCLLKEVIPVLKSEGFNLVTIEQLLNPDYPPALITH